MSVALKNLPHYTYDDYCQWEGRWELIDGIPYSMSPLPGFHHQDLNLKICTQLTELLTNCGECKVYMPIDWKVSEDTVVQPDVSVICGIPKNDQYLDFAPSIVFEILSPSTSQKDKTVKFEIYRREGVKYYIIVDRDKNIADVFELKNKKYNKIVQAKNQTIPFKIKKCLVNFNFEKIW